ncbi:MAG: hypothetical protein P4L55_20705 [Syntrophobacteraceae bacterium]|nr:hypothetical protein [Syntrophobacteraceae bacterium]
MAKDRLQVTQGIRVLQGMGIRFIERPYRYEDRGGTEVAARELGVNEHQVIKTSLWRMSTKTPS